MYNLFVKLENLTLKTITGVVGCFIDYIVDPRKIQSTALTLPIEFLVLRP